MQRQLELRKRLQPAHVGSFAQSEHCECHEMGGLTILMLGSIYPDRVLGTNVRYWPKADIAADPVLENGCFITAMRPVYSARVNFGI